MVGKIGIYKDPRNKKRPWVVRWFGEYDPTTGRQRRYSKAFRLKVEAEQFQASKRKEFSEGTVPRDGRPTVTLGSFCSDWLKTRRREYSPETVDLYENAIRRLHDYFGKDALLSTINPLAAAKFLSELARLDGRKGELSNWSRHRALRNCKTMFTDAANWGLIAKNPFAAVKRPKLVIQEWHYLKPDEYQRLLEVAPLRWRACYALVYCCGLRKGELLSLPWSDIDVDAGEVRIRNRPETGKHPGFRVKDAEARNIPIPQHCLNLLADLKAYNDVTDQTPYVALNERQYNTLLRKCKRFREQKRPFRNQDWQNNTLVQFKRHCMKAGIAVSDETLCLHTLRKTCITNWANEINNPEVVRQLAGHSDIKTTMQYYSQTTKEQRAKAAGAIDNLLKNTDVKVTYGGNSDTTSTQGEF